MFCALGVLCSSGILFHLENLIYNELRNWGFSVDVGNIQQQGRSGQTVSVKVSVKVSVNRMRKRL